MDCPLGLLCNLIQDGFVVFPFYAVAAELNFEPSSEPLSWLHPSLTPPPISFPVFHGHWTATGGAQTRGLKTGLGGPTEKRCLSWSSTEDGRSNSNLHGRQ